MKNEKRHGKFRGVPAALLISLAVAASAHAQATQPADADEKYEKMIDDRADKIIQPLGLDADKAVAVKVIMLRHYHNLKEWNAVADPKLKALQTDLNAATKANDAAAVDRIKADMAGVRGSKQPMHDQFVRDLVKVVPFTKVNAIKDGMTYNYVAVRMGIMEKLGLNDEQRTEIRDMLVATREIAMDAGTSDEKHKLFGETLGRVSLRVLTPEQNEKLDVMKGKPPKKPAATQGKAP